MPHIPGSVHSWKWHQRVKKSSEIEVLLSEIHKIKSIIFNSVICGRRCMLKPWNWGKITSVITADTLEGRILSLKHEDIVQYENGLKTPSPKQNIHPLTLLYTEKKIHLKLLHYSNHLQLERIIWFWWFWYDTVWYSMKSQFKWMT